MVYLNLVFNPERGPYVRIVYFEVLSEIAGIMCTTSRNF